MRPLPFLTVDGGSLLFKRDQILPAQEEEDKITAAGIVTAYNYMGYDAVGVSMHDMTAGLDFLRGLAAQSKFTWLSANLVKKSTGKPIFKPSIIKKIANMKIAVVGITGIDPSLTLSDKDDAKIIPWQEVLPKLVAQLEKSSDMIILLASLTPEQVTEVANTLPAVNIIIQSNLSSNCMEPQKTNSTYICQTGKQGKYLGWLAINWNPETGWPDPNLLANSMAALERMKLRQQEAEEKYKRYWEQGNPEERYQSDPNKMWAYRDLVKSKDLLPAEIAKLEKEVEKQKLRSINISEMSNTFINMDSRLPDHPEVRKIVDEIKNKVNQAGQRKTSSGIQAAPVGSQAGQPQIVSMEEVQELPFLTQESFPYTGWQKCAGCHQAQTASWQKQRHAAAYQTLVAKNQQYNSECLPCHVTAVFKGDESFARSLPADLQQVGCEACHGPGKAHGQDGALGAAAPTRPSEHVCLRCHTPERDDAFTFALASKGLGCLQQM